MLPHSYNAGFSNDVRGFRKKNKPLKIYLQYSPYIAAFQFILLLLVAFTLSANVRHEKKIVERLSASHKSKELEIRNLANTLDQERKSRVSAENGLRDSNSQLSGARRELQELRTSESQKQIHSQSLQESFDRTRTALESERDVAKRDLEEARKRIHDLETQIVHKDNTIDAHKSVASRKQEIHDSKEREWEALREQLQQQLRQQGDFVPQQTAEGNKSVAHPDYAAKDGSGAFHFTSDGHRERFLDTAKDLHSIGVISPKGVEHLAQLMGHLIDIKQAEYAAIQKAYPADNPPPKPPIGHWMALNLERMGVSVPHGTMHLSYFLDAHFALDNNPSLVGRGKETYTEQDPVAAPPVSELPNQVGSTTQTEQAKQADPAASQAGQENDVDPLANLRRGRKGHRVDAAGFI